VCGIRMFVSLTAVVMGCRGVFLGQVMAAMLMMMRRFPVVMRSRLVVASRSMMVFGRGVGSRCGHGRFLSWGMADHMMRLPRQTARGA
jgi:hypothetical protein